MFGPAGYFCVTAVPMGQDAICLCPQHAKMWAVAHVSDLAARPELTTSASSMALHWTIPNVFSHLAENGFLSSV